MHTNLQISHWFIRLFRFDVIFNIKNKRKQRFLVDSKACYTPPIQHDFIEIYLFDSLIRLNLLCDWAWTARLFWTNECLILIFFPSPLSVLLTSLPSTRCGKYRRHDCPKGEEQTFARRDGGHTPGYPEYVKPFLHARLSMFSTSSQQVNSN